jgi:hypothetical protein
LFEKHSLWGSCIVTKLILRVRGVLIAVAALALSASLAFGAQPAGSWGLSNAASHAGKTVPVKAVEQGTATDETTDGTTDQTTQTTDASTTGDNCATDPSALTAEELAAMKHGSIVCWAAHQTTWPVWFSNHGAFVSCWAHTGKAGAPSCTVAPAAAPAGAIHGNGNAKGPKNK